VGYIERAKILLAREADLMVRHKYERTGLQLASEHRQSEIVELLF